MVVVVFVVGAVAVPKEDVFVHPVLPPPPPEVEQEIVAVKPEYTTEASDVKTNVRQPLLADDVMDAGIAAPV